MSGVALRVGRPWAPDRLTAMLRAARRVRQAPGEPLAGSLLGIEHEYRVLGPDGLRVDFRALLPTLPVPGRALDPADRHALRLPWGAALTCDDAEAEVALPPLAVRRGTATLAATLADRARDELAAILPAGHTIEGYSTHCSVAMPTEVAEVAAHRYARTFAPGLMLLLDGPDAPGLLVRPRPGRLELGGDFRAGAGLSAAALFALGSALAIARAVSAGRGGALPPLLEITPEPAVERYGWYVDRAAFDGDLYADGRAAALPLAGGGTMSAGEHLALAWAAARRELRGRATRDELRLVDDLVAGRRPLPVEAAAVPGAWVVATPASAAPAFRAPEGHLLDDIVRPAFTLRATLATWEMTVFEATGARRAIVAVPRRELGGFLASASTGLLDGPLERFLARPSTGDVLLARDQALAGTRAWDGIGDPRALIADEPDGTGPAPGTGRAAGAGRAAVAGVRVALAAGRLAGVDLDGPDLPDDRPGKRRRRRDDDRHDDGRQEQGSQDTPARPQPRPRPHTEAPASLPAVAPAGGVPILAILGGAVAIVAVVVVLMTSGVLGGSGPSPSPSLAAAASAAPSPSDIAAAPNPDPSVVVPVASAAPTEPPLELARIEGTYNDGPDDSYRITVTPACDSGACDGSASVFSLPIAASAPRASVSMPFARADGGYSGEGGATVPVCRSSAGDVLSAPVTYRLDGFRATAQALIDGEWIATAISGTFVVGSSAVSTPGLSCSSPGSSEAVVLGWNDPTATPAPSPTATPAPTKPPLGQARFAGSYGPKGGTALLRSVAECPAGACDVSMTMEYALDESVTKTETFPMAYDGSSYSGQVTFTRLRCSNGSRANVTIRLRDFKPTKQALVGGQWMATELQGSFVRLKFKQTSGPGCFGNTQTSKLTITRRP